MTGLLSPYLFLFGLLLCLVYPFEKANESNRAKIMWGLLVTFVLFFGLRGNVGDDYVHYQSMYQAEASTYFLSMPAFALFMGLLKAVHIPFAGFIFVCSCIINSLLFRFIWRLGANLPLVLAIFLGFSGIVNEIDFIRNAISILLFANSLEYVIRQEPKKYFLLNGLSVLIHYSALLYMPFYLLCRKPLTKPLFLGIIAIGMLLSIAQPPFLDLIPRLLDSDSSAATHLYTYINTYTRVMSFTIASAERLLTAVGIYLLFDVLSQNEWYRVGTWGFLSFFIFYSLFSHYAVLGTRLANLFVVCYWILWPGILRCIQRPWLKFVSLFVMCSYLAVRLLSLSLMSQWHFCFLWG